MYYNLKIVQHNVLAWTDERSKELSAVYNKINPAIILLNSVSVRDNKPVKIYNYNVYSKNHLNEFQAGVAIAVRKTLQYKILDDFVDDILGIQVITTRGPVEIYTLYSPPRRHYLPLGEIKRIFQKTIPTYFIGDLNALHNLMGYLNSVNNKGRTIYNLVNNDGVKYLGPDFKTLVIQNGKPDIILANRWAFFNISIIQGKVTTSDHLPIHIELSTRPIIKEYKKNFNYKKAKWDDFQSKLENKTVLSDMNNKTQRDIDNEIQNWMNNIMEVAEETIPKNKLSYFIHPPNSDFINILENQYQQLMTLNHWTRDHLELIKNIQILIKNESKRLQDETWSNKLSKLQESYMDPKTFWADVRKIIGEKKEEVPYLIGNNGNKLFTEVEKEKEFNEIWSNIFKIDPQDNLHFDQDHEETVNNYVRNNEEQITPFERSNLDRLNIDNYLLRPVTNQDIKIIIKEFKHKAPGKSGITKLLLMKIPEIAITKFKDIINATISMGYFPIILKNGLIILIPKPGKDAKNPINYRPITLLELPGKILEKIVNKRFQRFCEDNEVFHKNQFGFRKGTGTHIALTKIYEKIAINQKRRDHCNLICRDISKAFDKIWLNGLRYKIIRQNELPILIMKMLSSFVSDRTAQIRINSHIGDKFSIKSGVPQGGILSPTLFIFYTSDLTPAGPNSDDVIFADDITQIIVNEDNDKMQHALDTEREILRINAYERKWKIKTNTTKFKILAISKTRPINIQLDNQVMPFSNDCTILGTKFKRTGMANHITNRVNLAKAQTSRIKRFMALKEKTKLHLFKALIRPVLEYPVITNALASKHQMLKMQKVQNANLNIIAKNTENELKTIKELHEIYDIEPINIRLFKAAERTWEKYLEKDPEMENRARIENNNRINDHNWWPRIAHKMHRGEPPPLYVST